MDEFSLFDVYSEDAEMDEQLESEMLLAFIHEKNQPRREWKLTRDGLTKHRRKHSARDREKMLRGMEAVHAGFAKRSSWGDGPISRVSKLLKNLIQEQIEAEKVFEEDIQREAREYEKYLDEWTEIREAEARRELLEDWEIF